jgi:hypothetical protein
LHLAPIIRPVFDVCLRGSALSASVHRFTASPHAFTLIAFCPALYFLLLESGSGVWLTHGQSLVLFRSWPRPSKSSNGCKCSLPLSLLSLCIVFVDTRKIDLFARWMLTPWGGQASDRHSGRIHPCRPWRRRRAHGGRNGQRQDWRTCDNHGVRKGLSRGAARAGRAGC